VTSLKEGLNTCKACPILLNTHLFTGSPSLRLSKILPASLSKKGLILSMLVKKYSSRALKETHIFLNKHYNTILTKALYHNNTCAWFGLVLELASKTESFLISSKLK